MSTPVLINVPYLVGVLENTALWGFADPVQNMRKARVWLLSALNDTVVDTGVVEAAASMYSAFVESSEQIQVILDKPGEHSQLTLSYGNLCDTLGKPFINDCGFDAAGSILEHILAFNLTRPSRVSEPQGKLSSFSQAAFVGGELFTEVLGLENTGYIYVPPQCENQAQLCPLHVAFHGCEMTLDDIGTKYVEHGGYLPWADANGLIILFPQAKANVLNPKGCWDWWGYTGTAFASNVGGQTLTVKRFVDSLTGQPLTPNSSLSTATLESRLRSVLPTDPDTLVQAARDLERRGVPGDPRIMP
jgi:hypothetical protein